MNHGATKPRIALVYPPYSPAGTPSLGLALLSAGIKQRGFDCRTFYWNFDLIDALPGTTPLRKLFIYNTIANQFPASEWVFVGLLFPELQRGSEAEIQRSVNAWSQHWLQRLYVKRDPWSRSSSPMQIFWDLRNQAASLVSTMAERLAPYDVVGINTTFYQNLPALALAQEVKRRWPQKQIVLGGANCDGEMGRTLLEQFTAVDYVFTGEVDHAFPEFIACLAQHAPVDHVPGVLYRDAFGQIVEGPKALPLQDLESLPVPDYDDYVAERQRLGFDAKFELVLALESSRGCWWGAKHHCTFCGLNANGMGYRQKSYERFKWEVEAILERYAPRLINMTDNIMSMQYYREFLDWAQTRSLGVDFFYEIKANVTRKQVRRLAQAGVSYVQPGIESLSSELLTLMQKGVKGIQNVALLKYARENGIQLGYNLLYGFPGEAPEAYVEMIQHMPKLSHLAPPDTLTKVEFHRFSPYHTDPGRFGIQLRSHHRYRFLYPFPEAVLSRLVYVFKRVDDDPEPPYVNDLAQAFSNWSETYQADACTLRWRTCGADIAIFDQRPGFPVCHYRLQDHAVAVFSALDAPTTLQAAIDKAEQEATSGHPEFEDPELEGAPLTEAWPSAPHRATETAEEGTQTVEPGATTAVASEVDEVVVTFSAEAFAADPGGCLQPLVAAGLVYVENGWYVSLPVHVNHRKELVEWRNVRA